MSSKRCSKLLLVCCVLLCVSAVAVAQHEPPTQLFQLNGLAGSTAPSRPGSDNLKDPGPGFLCNYTNGGASSACDNWNLLNGPPVASGHSVLNVFIKPATLVFTKGTKDTQDSGSWDWAPHGSPGKDTFNAGYGAAYAGPTTGDVIVEFGADRATNNGDANIGIWFFQLPVAPNADGTFGCGLPVGQPCHTNGDIFVTSAFTNGGGLSVINTYAWDTGCSGITSPTGTTMPGQCADTNLALLLAPGTECTINSFECGVTNSVTTHTSWEGAILSPQFFEGGVNITAALNAIGITNPPCFSTFQIETRASQSTGAELKAFIGGNFRTCTLGMNKSCSVLAVPPSPRIVYNNNNPYVHYDFGGTLTTKSGAVYNPIVTDTFPATSVNMTLQGGACPGAGCACITNQDSSISCSKQITGNITNASSLNYSGSFDYPGNGSITNELSATASSNSSGTPQNVIGKDSGGNTTTTATLGDPATSCHVSPNPVLGLTKYCDVRLEPTSSGVVLRQDDTITVCNNSTDSTTQIKGITVLNDVVHGATGDSVFSGSLGPNNGTASCQTVTKTYTPTDCDNDSGTVDFGGNTYPGGAINPVVGVNGDAAGGDPGVTSPVPGRCRLKDTAYISGTPTDEFGHALSSSQIPMPAVGTCNLCLFGYCTTAPPSGPTN